MFENIVTRIHYKKKLLGCSNGLVACNIGPQRHASLVVISQTQDKLIVFDISSSRDILQLDPENGITMIAVNDVVCSLSSQKIHGRGPDSLNEFLLIGCTTSILVYENLSQTNLLRINTSSKICAFFDNILHHQYSETESELMICGGVQKIYALQLELSFDSKHNNWLGSGETTSERGTSDTISCLVRGTFQDSEIILTGSIEHKIRLYQLDLFDFNIQACELTIEESAPVNCMCGILTKNDSTSNKHDDRAGLRTKSNTSRENSLLPAIEQNASCVSAPVLGAQSPIGEQLRHLAFGLENGLVGVYRLYRSSNNPKIEDCDAQRTTPSSTKMTFGAERLWRHKSKQVPVSIIMFDLNGDGYDEIIIGYRGGRLEARSPFTGQLLAVTRCFRSDKLVGLTSTTRKSEAEKPTDANSNLFGLNLRADQQEDSIKFQPRNSNQLDESPGTSIPILLACSTSGHLIAYRARKFCKRKPLRCFDMQAVSSSTGNRRFDMLSFSESTQFCAGPVLNDDLIEADDQLKSITLKTIEEMSDEQEAVSLRLRLGCKDSDELVGGDEFDSDQNNVGLTMLTDSKQDPDLIQQIGRLQNDRRDLEQKACNAYHETMQQVTSLTDIASNHMFQSDQAMNIAYKWNFPTNEDAKSLNLSFSVLIVSPKSESIDFIELNDSDGYLIGKNFLFASSADGLFPESTNHIYKYTFQLRMPDTGQQTRMTIRLYTTTVIERTKSKLTEQQALARVFERYVPVPRFCNLVPKSKLSTQGESRSDNLAQKKVRLSFRINDDEDKSINYEERQPLIEIFEWLGQNLLCFQSGHWINETHNDEFHWPASLSLVDGEDQEAPVTLDELMNHESVRFSIEEWSQIAKQPGDGVDNTDSYATLELKLSYFDKFDDTNSIGRSELILLCRQNEILIECDNYHLLADIIRSLVVDHLKLNVTPDSIGCNKLSEEDETSGGAKPIVDALERLTQNSRDLEESERRAETELYEATDLVQDLMQQFYIAQKISEFSISRELLNEISIIFDGAQNSARAYYLNNCEKLRLTREANHLREKLSFLLGGN